jgi:hypothetical protein
MSFIQITLDADNAARFTEVAPAYFADGSSLLDLITHAETSQDGSVTFQLDGGSEVIFTLGQVYGAEKIEGLFDYIWEM